MSKKKDFPKFLPIEEDEEFQTDRRSNQRNRRPVQNYKKFWEEHAEEYDEDVYDNDFYR